MATDTRLGNPEVGNRGRGRSRAPLCQPSPPSHVVWGELHLIEQGFIWTSHPADLNAPCPESGRRSLQNPKYIGRRAPITGRDPPWVTISRLKHLPQGCRGLRLRARPPRYSGRTRYSSGGPHSISGEPGEHHPNYRSFALLQHGLSARNNSGQ